MGNGDDRPPGRLTEQHSEGVHAVATADLVQPDPGTHPVAQRGLGQGDSQPTLGQVVRRFDQALARGIDQDLAQSALTVEVDVGRQTTEVIVRDLGPGRATELVGRGAKQVDVLTGGLPARGGPAGHIVHHAQDRDHRGRMDGHVGSLVVQRDVASGHRDAESPAARRDAPHGLGELPHDAGVLW